METIRFQNKVYKVREIELAEIGSVLISTNSLNKLLLNEYGGYVSDEASEVDDSIFYFVDDKEIEFSEKELKNLTSEIV